MLLRMGRITQFFGSSFSSGVVGRAVPFWMSGLSVVESHDAMAALSARAVAGGRVVVVAPFGVAGSGGMSASTGRNRSWAVRPTRRSAFAWSFTPGSSTTMSLPCLLMLGSATPKLLTRLFMMLRVSSSAPGFGCPTG